MLEPRDLARLGLRPLRQPHRTLHRARVERHRGLEPRHPLAVIERRLDLAHASAHGDDRRDHLGRDLALQREDLPRQPLHLAVALLVEGVGAGAGESPGHGEDGGTGSANSTLMSNLGSGHVADRHHTAAER